MLETKDKEHNLMINKSDFLTPSQKGTLLFLAKNRPMTINELNTNIKGHWKTTYEAFKELEKKRLIQKLGTKKYRGNDYDRYWVSETGIVLALSERLKPEILLKKTIEYYPENRELQFLIEAIPILGQSAFNM